MTETYDKINYWFGWNGGECPVHPETEVELMHASGHLAASVAGRFDWEAYRTYPIIAFRITRLHVAPRKPREWWACEYAGGVHGKFYPDAGLVPIEPAAIGMIHVREVLPDAD